MPGKPPHDLLRGAGRRDGTTNNMGSGCGYARARFHMPSKPGHGSACSGIHRIPALFQSAPGDFYNSVDFYSCLFIQGLNKDQLELPEITKTTNIRAICDYLSTLFYSK